MVVKNLSWELLVHGKKLLWEILVWELLSWEKLYLGKKWLWEILVWEKSAGKKCPDPAWHNARLTADRVICQVLNTAVLTEHNQ